MTNRTTLRLHLADGEVLSLDGGRVVITLHKRSGRLSTLRLDMAAEVKVDKPAPPAASVREPPPFGGYV